MYAYYHYAGSSSKDAEECRKQIDAMIRQKDANNERYQQQLIDMQKEMESRHRNDLAEMTKLHKEAMAQMSNAIAHIDTGTGPCKFVENFKL